MENKIIKQVDNVVATPEEVIGSLNKKISILNQDIEREKALRIYAEDSLKLYDDSFDFSQLWLDQEPSKMNLTGIISIVLLVIVMIIVLIK